LTTKYACGAISKAMMNISPCTLDALSYRCTDIISPAYDAGAAPSFAEVQLVRSSYPGRSHTIEVQERWWE